MGSDSFIQPNSTALGPIIDDVSLSFWQMRIVLIWRRKFILVFISRYFNTQTHSLTMASNIALNIVYMVCSFSHTVIRPFRFSYTMSTPLHISSYIVFANIRVLTFFTVGRRSCTQTKRSLCSLLSFIYPLKLFLPIILEL